MASFQGGYPGESQSPSGFEDGAVQHYLGEEIRLCYKARPCPTVLQDGVLTFFARNESEARYAFEVWLDPLRRETYYRVERDVREAYAKAGFTLPRARMQIKEMTSRWGSCTAAKARISINARLIRYPIECIYAVFYHEYAHFLRQDHSRAFYDILYRVCPDYDRHLAVLQKTNL